MRKSIKKINTSIFFLNKNINFRKHQRNFFQNKTSKVSVIGEWSVRGEQRKNGTTFTAILSQSPI